MKEIKKAKTRERQGYATPRVKAINVTAQRVMCTSPNTVNDPFGGSDEENI